VSHRGLISLTLGACIVFSGCTETQLQSFNNSVSQFNTALAGGQQGTIRSAGASNQQGISDPARIDSLDEILKTYVEAAPVPVSDACGYDHKPVDVSFYLQRASGAAKVGDDITASSSLRIAVATVAAQGVGMPGNSVLVACVPASQVYSPVGQWLALAVITEKRSRLLSAAGNLKIDAANALALLESDPVRNKSTIDNLIATGLVSRAQAHPSKKPLS
jgi:hypothetical protein